MHISFPSQLTEDEENLLKKLSKLKQKKKQYLEAKANKEQQNAETIAQKRKSTEASASTDDAKETAMKLIKSGIIKLESESKEKGFKRSLSRRETEKKIAITPMDQEPSPFFRSTLPSPQVDSPTMSLTFNRTRFNYSNPNTGTNRPFTPNFQQRPPSFSLHIKGDNITEEFLRNVFTTNVPNSNIVSIDLKKNYAFVSLDSKEVADNAIQILDGKAFNEITLGVSHARPRKSFSQFNQPRYSNPNAQSPSFSSHRSFGDRTGNNTPTSSGQNSRNVVSYDDEQEFFN